MSWMLEEFVRARRRWLSLPRQYRPVVTAPEQRLICCTIPVCTRCGGHDPLSGHGTVCRCGRWQ